MKTETLNSMKERRSVIAYKSEQITKEELDIVLEAGTYAASGMGRQASKIVAIQDKETSDIVRKLNAQARGTTADPFYGAPTIIVVFSDSTVNTCVEDGSLVIGNLMLGAYSVGLGSCWIHWAKETFETEEGKALKKKWGLPENYLGVGNCALGYPAASLPAAKPRKEDYIVKI